MEEIEQIKAQSLCSRIKEKSFELNSDLVQIVIGVRRSGKSPLSHKVLLDRNIKIHKTAILIKLEKLS